MLDSGFKGLVDFIVSSVCNADSEAHYREIIVHARIIWRFHDRSTANIEHFLRRDVSSLVGLYPLRVERVSSQVIALFDGVICVDCERRCGM